MAVTKAAVMKALAEVIDPELGIDIVALGLIYGVEITGDNVRVEMTLTTPGCPLAPVIDRLIQDKVGSVNNVKNVSLYLVWDPPWTPQLMSPSARAELGFD